MALHHRCDHLLAAAETQLQTGAWPSMVAAAEGLIAAMLEHFRVEEEQLFPQLAEVFQAAASPIEVMCSEHAQMRALLEDLGAAVEAHDQGACTGILETLHFLVQQHNYKEETVLYPMADGALREAGVRIAAQLSAE
ncbi:hemerythrin domain-containing protein [Thiorhodococcus mannitoliphagus]|uniref:Hemerythrin domain-containing protein n=1 Tax=Thiorhodococcus mannitoliphagus TaxID=329406 RepID=A0A6P1E1P8_9GAMM|nr:hemerythrin domain-containing protein [Thiorhodococcus mannitoliphagus]NEX23251.1 hemerythrin domain-containing protein [Thiorhodococcus mannitoliphagus]